jgi:hypothetical protein
MIGNLHLNLPASNVSTQNIAGGSGNQVTNTAFDKGTNHFLMELNGTREADGFAGGRQNSS